MRFTNWLGGFLYEIPCCYVFSKTVTSAKKQKLASETLQEATQKHQSTSRS